MGEKLNNNHNGLMDGTQYETIISAIPGGIVITKADDDFTLLFANQGYYDMVGYEKEEHIKKFNNIGIDTLHPDEAGAAALSAKEQLSKTGTFSVKAKLSHKSKGYIWVHFSGKLNVSPEGDTKIYIVIVDISDHQQTLEKLEKEQTFNELIAMLSDDAFFDYDILTDSMRYSKNFADRFKMPEILHKYKESLLKHSEENGSVNKENILFCTENYNNCKKDIFEEEIHLKDPNGENVWYLCRSNIIRDDSGTPVRTVGRLIDVTQHKIKIDELSELAQRDQLTGLYNKTATEHLITEILKQRKLQEEKCALMIIDIDNFKDINDYFGHLYGDVVLNGLAEVLPPLFRSDDIIGRVGGDEFFIFLKNYNSTELLKAKAKAICSLFSKTYKEGDVAVNISASIGIALCPEHGEEFSELYTKADMALYNAKAKGKNSYSFYNIHLKHTYVSARTEIESNIVKKSFKDNRIEYVFKLLYDSENTKNSIQSVLRLVTESFGFSRGYIFETSSDNKTTSNTFEWCANGIGAEIQNLQNIPLEAVATSTANFNKTGMFILKSIDDLAPLERAVLEPQGIVSMFQFGIMDAGKLVGFIGFDDCVAHRVPTDMEIDEICTICHVLATFLLKHRSAQKKQSHHKAMESIMDNMSNYAYVIDKQSYDVLYENLNVINTTGKSSLGEKCYSAYRGNEAPCEDCPMAQLSETTRKYSMEVYNKKFNLYVHTDATWIEWSDNKNACLISSIDITKYKNK